MKKIICMAAMLAAVCASAQDFKVKVNTDKEPVHEGKYEGTVESLSDYVCPEWFRDAKFGIWAPSASPKTVIGMRTRHVSGGKPQLQ